MTKNFYTQEKLQKICANSESLAEVLRKLGIKPSGGNYAALKRKIKLFNIDISHFSGHAWNKGKKCLFPAKNILGKKFIIQVVKFRKKC